MNEGSLHAELKELYAEPGDEFEVELGGFVIDIRRGSTLIEIQTGSFAAMGKKLDHLLAEHRLLIVYPIAVATYLHRPSTGAKPRRSPKKHDAYSVFDELVSMPTVLDHPNLSVEVVLAEVDKIQHADPAMRRNRGGWRTVDRRLRSIRNRLRFDGVADLAALVPGGLPERFTTAHLAEAADIPRDRAQRMAYCLRANGVFEPLERSRAGVIYRNAPTRA